MNLEDMLSEINITKGQTLYNLRVKLIETVEWWVQGTGGRDYCLMGDFSSGRWKRFGHGQCDGCTTMWSDLMSPNYAVKDHENGFVMYILQKKNFLSAIRNLLKQSIHGRNGKHI